MSAPLPPPGRLDPRTIERLARALADALEVRLQARRRRDSLRKEK